jgi:oxygen-independent coproporphyrinogen-3 oxidase
VKKLSLYIHIPFCIQKCRYCDFYSAPAGEKQQAEYTRMLCREIRAWGKQLSGMYQVDTVFFGGGTPSCLPPYLLAQIGTALKESFDCSHVTEYTIEANPGTVTSEQIALWRQMGVDRVSVGLQSAQDEELEKLGRIHDFARFLSTYELLRREGMETINVDIMSAIPGQTFESYRDTLERVAALRPEHISAYSLIVEPGTVFWEMEQQGLLSRPDEETDRAMYEFTGKYLGEQGYHRYEISNYAIPGKECRHNCVYWTGGEYLGMGQQAASYIYGYRFFVPTGVDAYEKYLTAVEQGIFCREEMTQEGKNLLVDVTKTDLNRRIEEFMFLGLRMTEGVSKKEFEKRFGREIKDIYGTLLDRLTAQGLLEIRESGDRICLTQRGIDVSNPVLAEFLLDS